MTLSEPETYSTNRLNDRVLVEDRKMESSSTEAVTLIVGAGVSGLTAANTLAQAGEKCLLVEKAERVGGMCRSYTIDNITFDLGPHLFFHNPDSAPEKLMFDLIKDEQVLQRKTRYAIYTDGKYWKQPLRPWDPLFFPKKFKKDFILSRFSKGNENRLQPDSLAYSLSKIIGHAYYSELYAPLLLKKTLLSGKQLHRHWLQRADRGIDHRREEPHNIGHSRPIKQFLRLVLNSQYYYPVKGFEIFPQKLWQRYQQAGGRTILGCVPVILKAESGRIVSADINGRTYNTKNVIWTGSINELNNLLSRKTPPVRYVDTLIACLTYNCRPDTQRPFVYVYYPAEDLIFDRLYFPRSIYQEAFIPGRDGVCVEINNSEIFKEKDEGKVITRISCDLEKLGIFSRTDLREQRLFRLKNCMPVHTLDYERELEQTFEEVHQYQNLYSVGRKGGYFFCQTPHAISQGLKVAAHLLSDKKDK